MSYNKYREQQWRENLDDEPNPRMNSYKSNDRKGPNYNSQMSGSKTTGLDSDNEKSKGWGTPMSNNNNKSKGWGSTMSNMSWPMSQKTSQQKTPETLAQPKSPAVAPAPPT